MAKKFKPLNGKHVPTESGASHSIDIPAGSVSVSDGPTNFVARLVGGAGATNHTANQAGNFQLEVLGKTMPKTFVGAGTEVVYQREDVDSFFVPSLPGEL